MKVIADEVAGGPGNAVKTPTRGIHRHGNDPLAVGSDDEIFKFMTDRYGEFVRFSPPLEPKTLLIWGAPFIILLLGVAIIYRVARQRSRLPLDDEPTPGPTSPGPTSPGPM